MKFKDRQQAGRLLAQRLENYKNTDSVILAIPRGGVVVAAEIAKNLQLPLDIIAVRKIPYQTNTELAIGAIASTGESYFDEGLISNLSVPADYITAESERQKQEAIRREYEYRSGGPLGIKDKTIVLIDDGIATGATVYAAIKKLRKEQAGEVVVAIPVAPSSTVRDLELQVDKVIALSTPEPFYAVGNFYQEFPQVSDEEVKRLLSGKINT